MESGVVLYHMPLTDISGENLTLIVETRRRVEDLQQTNIALLENLKIAQARVIVLESRFKTIEKVSLGIFQVFYVIGVVWFLRWMSGGAN